MEGQEGTVEGPPGQRLRPLEGLWKTKLPEEEGRRGLVRSHLAAQAEGQGTQERTAHRRVLACHQEETKPDHRGPQLQDRGSQ